MSSHWLTDLDCIGIMFGYIAGVALHAVSDGASPNCFAHGTFKYKASNGTTMYGDGILPPRLSGNEPTYIEVTNVRNAADLLAANCVGPNIL